METHINLFVLKRPQNRILTKNIKICYMYNLWDVKRIQMQIEKYITHTNGREDQFNNVWNLKCSIPRIVKPELKLYFPTHKNCAAVYSLRETSNPLNTQYILWWYNYT